MAIKIMIKRRVDEGSVKELSPLIKQLRFLATQQSGYISGETLRSIEHPGEYLVISTWQTFDDWKNWVVSKERSEIQDKIDILLGQETEYSAYTY